MPDLDPEAKKLNDLRQRVLENTHVDEAELAHYIEALVGERIKSAEAPKAKKAKSPKVPPRVFDLNDLLPKK